MEKALQPYASFLLGINYECNSKMQKRAFNSIGLSNLIGCDLGFDNELDALPPTLAILDKPLVEEPYVCLSVSGSMKCKCWNNPDAIEEVVSWLKENGYRVMLVDKENKGLYGAEDWTGARPMIERTTLFSDAELFIGVSSGLSWVAWACNCPVVLVSGFTEPWVEFKTPYRVQNANVCHGCWNDLKRCYFGCEGDEEHWCPEKKNFECTRKITSQMVLQKVKDALGVY